MKKWLLVLILTAVLILIAVSVYLVLQFTSLYQETNATEPAALQSVQEYAAENLSEYDARYDGATQVLTLERAASISYADACLVGGKIYADELAPETYLGQVQSIALNVASNCDCTALTVVLSYVSNDGKAIFTVSSNGDIWTCWE